MASTLPKEVREEKQHRAWLLRQEFWTQERIAEELGLNQATISRMLAAEGQRQAKAFEARALAIKGEQTAQLQRIADEAFQAWKRSLKDAEQSTVTAIRAPAPKSDRLPDLGRCESREDVEDALEEALAAGDFEPPLLDTQVVTVTKGQSGNPALLAQARAALAEIRDIWGLDAPTKADITSGGEPIKGYTVVATPDDL